MKSINHYTLEQAIARGAEGSVFKAIDTQSGQEVAVKVIVLKSEETTEKVLREQNILRSANSNYLVKVLDVVQTDRNLYIVYPLYPTDLRHFLRQNGPVSEDVAQRWATQLVKGLLDLHYYEVVHRDLKPANILLTEASLDADLIITDFGVSTLCSSAMLSSFVGSLNYMAPEVIEGQLYNDKADVFSLGVILLEVLGGTPEGRQLPDQISSAAEAFLNACLEEDPANRPTAFELALHPFLRKAKRERLGSKEPLARTQTIEHPLLRVQESVVLENLGGQGEPGVMQKILSIFTHHRNESRDVELHEIRGSIIETAEQLSFFSDCLAFVYQLSCSNLLYYYIKANESQMRHYIALANASRFCGTTPVQCLAAELENTLEAVLSEPPTTLASAKELDADARSILTQVAALLAQPRETCEKNYLTAFVRVAAGLSPASRQIQEKCVKLTEQIRSL